MQPATATPRGCTQARKRDAGGTRNGRRSLCSRTWCGRRLMSVPTQGKRERRSARKERPGMQTAANKAKVLVTGATGSIGAGVVRELLGRSKDVRAFVRDPGKAAKVLGDGVELAVG